MRHFALWAAAVLLPCAAAAQSPAQSPAQHPVPFRAEQPTARVDYWQLRAAEIEGQLKAPQSLAPVRLVFIGDSITDFWHLNANPWFPGKWCGRTVWDAHFGGRVPARTALNLGVSGDRVEHVLHRLLPATAGGEGWLDRADLQPDTVFVMLGINNSFDAESPADTSIYRGVIAVIARIHERKPGARIVIQSLLPTDDPAKNRALVQPVNAQLRAFAASTPGLAWLDLYPAFVDAAGAQRKELFNDGLHPSRDGYQLWADRLTAFLEAR